DPGGVGALQAVQHVHQLYALLRGLPGRRPGAKVHRSGGAGAGEAVQPGFARRRPEGAGGGHRRPRRSLRVHLRRRVFGGLPQARGPGGRDPVDEGGHHDGVFQVVRAAAREEMKGKEYVRPMPSNWWLKKRNYTLFMVRELTAVFVAGYAIFLLVLIYRASQEPLAFFAFA